MVMCQSVKVLLKDYSWIQGFEDYSWVQDFEADFLGKESQPQNHEFRNNFIYKKVYLLITIASPIYFQII